VKYLILDEADRMLDMGFLPDMIKLVNSMGMPPKTERQTLMFSATFPEDVQKLAREILNDYIFVTVGHVGGANVDIEQRVIQADKQDKRERLISMLNEQGQSGHQIAVNFCRPFIIRVTLNGASDYQANRLLTLDVSNKVAAASCFKCLRYLTLR